MLRGGPTCRLKRENGVGTITFQEEVSMVPPVLLEIESFHRVIDLCSAPGSKTLEMLEMVHSASSVGPAAAAADSSSDGGVADGGGTDDISTGSAVFGAGVGNGAVITATVAGLNHTPSGVVVANDLDSKRVNNVLVGRLRKLHTPCVVVTISNAAKFPVLREVSGKYHVPLACEPHEPTPLFL
jgi:multisite-specific tRNA:(cytosine-C5)-methyltransferase